jgi:uncharacterized membrane-anchored protein YitT (DUF2179 family)
MHGWIAALFLMATTLSVRADDMTMVLPLLAVPFLAVGVVLALALWIASRRTRVRTGVLMGILAVSTLLTGVPGAMGAFISIPYVSSRFADIAIPFLIGFLVNVAVVALAFRAIGKRKTGNREEETRDRTASE